MEEEEEEEGIEEEEEEEEEEVISIAAYLTDKGEHTALYKTNRSVYI